MEIYKDIGRRNNFPFFDNSKLDPNLGPITLVRIWHNMYVEGIEVWYGEKSSGQHIGKERNKSTSVSELIPNADEFITEISGRSGHWIDSIEFKTNYGRVLKCGTSTGGNPFILAVPNMVVKSFKFEVGSYLNYLGAVFGPSNYNPVIGPGTAPLPIPIAGQMPGSMPGSMSGPMPGPMPIYMSEQMPGSMPGQMHRSMSGPTSGSMPGAMPGQMHRYMSGPIPGYMPGSMPEPMKGPQVVSMPVPTYPYKPVPTNEYQPQMDPKGGMGEMRGGMWRMRGGFQGHSYNPQGHNPVPGNVTGPGYGPSIGYDPGAGYGPAPGQSGGGYGPQPFQPIKTKAYGKIHPNDRFFDDYNEILAPLMAQNCRVEIDEVTIHSNDTLVVGIECVYRLTYIQGKVEFKKTTHIGSEKGIFSKKQTLKLNPGDVITMVKGKSGDLIDRLDIASVSGYMVTLGGKGGSDFNLIIPPGRKVIAFGGSTGGFLSSLYVYHA